MARAKVQDLNVSISRVVSGLITTIGRECDSNPLAPDALIELEDSLKKFESELYEKRDPVLRKICFKRELLFDPTNDLRSR